MALQLEDLRARHCIACEGNVSPLSRSEIEELLPLVPGWRLMDDGTRIQRRWTTDDFAAALEFLRKVGDVAERENHHPDLHLTNYRQVCIELTTHAIKGLSENDFIVAAKISDLPVELKKS